MPVSRCIIHFFENENLIDSEEIEILMQTKPEKYSKIIDKINILIKDAEDNMVNNEKE